MRATLILVALACLVTVCYGDLVCGTNYCKQNPCSKTVAKSSCSSGAVYKERHAGKCACCPACVTYLSEGASCKTYDKELGATPAAVCREGLYCIKGKCIAKPKRN